MKYWFTSDCHFGHENIIKYTKRPFKTLEEMNNTIATNWNSRVKPEDTVFHIGDFCFKNSPNGKEGAIHPSSFYEKQLNGKIIFIKGNHDNNNSTNAIIDNAEIHYGGMDIFITHNPLDADVFFKMNLVGHVHDKWKSEIMHGHGLDTVLVNVGVDVWGFKPISIEEILKEYQRRLNG